ncbi:MAG: ATP synthase F1 subunit epsilon [Marinosulfonomonas sp.]|nr:MAG: ATP synthase F1 subunit epsilon [Marinosulfonomonas sp.]
MADTMQFDLVSPERKLASVQASEVQLPGSEGDMTAMPDHAPTITTLRPGVLRVVSSEGDQEYLVTGGFAEITATSTSVLAEHAVPRDEVTQELLDSLMAEANEARETATAEGMDAAVKLVADMAAVTETLGLTAR